MNSWETSEEANEGERFAFISEEAKKGRKALCVCRIPRLNLSGQIHKKIHIIQYLEFGLFCFLVNDHFVHFIIHESVWY